MPATPASITLRNSMTSPKAPTTPAAIDLVNLLEAGAAGKVAPYAAAGSEILQSLERHTDLHIRTWLPVIVQAKRGFAYLCRRVAVNH